MQLLQIFADIQVWLRSSVGFQIQLLSVKCKKNLTSKMYLLAVSSLRPARIDLLPPSHLCSAPQMISLNWMLSTAPSEATGLCTEQWGGAAERSKAVLAGTKFTEHRPQSLLQIPSGDKIQLASAGREECATSGEKVNWGCQGKDNTWQVENRYSFWENKRWWEQRGVFLTMEPVGLSIRARCDLLANRWKILLIRNLLDNSKFYLNR